MTWADRIWTVFDFEFRRSLTWRRALLTLALAAFPAALISLVQLQGAHLERDDRGELFLFFLIPVVLCIVAVLLWATSLIHTELDEKTWTYLALRPVGRGQILIGKYLSAVAWTWICAAVSLGACLLILRASGDDNLPGGALALLAAVSATVYGAVFALIGVLFPARAMVAAIAYAAVMEALVAWLPSAINRFSVLYHLRCLFAHWILQYEGAHGPYFDSLFYGDAPPSQHLALLFAIAILALALATLLLRRRQFSPTADV